MKKLIFLAALVLLMPACAKEPVNMNNGGSSIVAFGDSITSGAGVTKEAAYPALLAKETRMPVINLGVSGNTMMMGANRKAEIAQYKPYMVLILFGGNDAMRGRPMRETQESLEAIIDYAQGLGAVAVVVDTGGNFKMSPYSKMQKKVAEEKRAVFVPAVYKGIFTDRSYKADAIHPNENGHKVIAQRILKIIKPYLKY
jgi:acyl-CoA thioesterase-1